LQSLRVGIVGTGFMGRVHAEAAIRQRSRVVAVAGSTQQATIRAIASWMLDARALSADALVSDPEVDVVHLCVPNHLHYPLAMVAMSHGKHVVCEKPLATNFADATELSDAADGYGVVGAVPFVYRYHPLVHQARELVRGGELGPVHLVHGSYLQDWLCDPSDRNWRVSASAGGASRAFGDIGSHWCDLAEWVTGHRITGLTAVTQTVYPTRPEGLDSGATAVEVTTEDIAVAALRTDLGAVGAVVVSQVSPGRKNRLLLEVSGPHGTVTFDQEDPERLWLGRRGQSTMMLRDPATLSPSANRINTLPAGHALGYHDCFSAFLADVRHAVHHGEVPDSLPTFRDGARAAEITDSVLRSASAAAW
jgi:predicted dehydrogenase